MKKNISPLCISASVTKGNTTCFYKIDEKVTLHAPGKLVRQIIEKCDGTRTINQITQALKEEWDSVSVKNLLHHLVQLQVLVSATNTTEMWWPLTANPSRFFAPISDARIASLVDKAQRRHSRLVQGRKLQIEPTSLTTLLSQRKSVRVFSENAVDMQALVNMLWSAYGEIKNSDSFAHRRTLPSAGALFPLCVHIVLFRTTGCYPLGVYRVLMGEPEIVQLELVSTDIHACLRAYVDPSWIESANGVVVLSGSFAVSGEKYSNRSVPYVVLEAGHSAQNIHIAATEFDVATVEVGGFYDQLMMEVLRLPSTFNPLTTIVFGRERREGLLPVEPRPIELKWAVPFAGKFRLPFTMVSGKFLDQSDNDWSCGRASSPRLAQIKAVAEMVEREACAFPSNLIQARFHDLEKVVDPRSIVSFHEEQYNTKGFALHRFNHATKYEWTKALDVFSIDETHVLADCVYYPFQTHAPRYAYATSSGVASHTDADQAVRNGVHELIERDSFMLAYLTKLAFPTISRKSMPKDIQDRLRNLERVGFKVWVKDYTLDFAPVVFVFVQSEKLTFTTCAACSDFDIESALDHALMEVESAVLHRLFTERTKAIPPAWVNSPSDHGVLYEQPATFRTADYMVAGRKVLSLRDVGKEVATDWAALMDKFKEQHMRLLHVYLNLPPEKGGRKEIKVVRSIVTGLIPIGFGYLQNPCGMERISTVAWKFGRKRVTYASLPQFPHPYT